MEDQLKRMLQHRYPALANGWFVPLFGRVTNIGEPAKGETISREQPIMAVTVQMLAPNGNDDEDMPLLEDVLVPVPAAGNAQGQWSRPAVGTVVEVAFAYGRPDQPFIRSIMPYGLQLPDNLPADSQRWATADDNHIQLNADGGQQHKAKERTANVAGDDKTKVDGNALVEAAKNLEQKAGEVQKLIAQKHHIGNEELNILQLVQEHMLLTAQVAQLTATHSHSYFWSSSPGASVTSPPLQMPGYIQQATQANGLTQKLAPLLA
jgi:hypothetical protein